MWTNTSLPPSEGMMNPNPLVALNHLTVPLAITLSLSVAKPRNTRGHGTTGPLDLLKAPDRRSSTGGKRGKASQNTIATPSWTESEPCVNDARMTFTHHAGLCAKAIRTEAGSTDSHIAD